MVHALGLSADYEYGGGWGNRIELFPGSKFDDDPKSETRIMGWKTPMVKKAKQSWLNSKLVLQSLK